MRGKMRAEAAMPKRRKDIHQGPIGLRRIMIAVRRNTRDKAPGSLAGVVSFLIHIPVKGAKRAISDRELAAKLSTPNLNCDGVYPSPEFCLMPRHRLSET